MEIYIMTCSMGRCKKEKSIHEAQELQINATQEDNPWGKQQTMHH